MPFANYNELSDSTFKLTLFVCFAHGRNKIKICPSYLKMESIRNWVSLIFSARGQKPCHGWQSQRFLKFPAFPQCFPDKCKISPAHCINSFTHQTWWWSQPSSPHSSLHLYTYAFSKSHAVHIMVFGGIWRYRMQRFSWQTRTICATCAYVECQCQSERLPWGRGGEG